MIFKDFAKQLSLQLEQQQQQLNIQLQQQLQQQVQPLSSTDPKKTKKVTKKQVADTGDAVVKAAKQNEALIEEVVSRATKGKVSKKQVEAVIEEAPGFWAKLKAFLGL